MRGAIRMEAFPLRPTAHDERLSVTEHLTELRARLLLSVAVLAVLFAGCLWQSRPLLRVLNAPLAQLETSSAAQWSGIELPQAPAAAPMHSPG
jgi:sec-independent protein translocase protein TatC